MAVATTNFSKLFMSPTEALYATPKIRQSAGKRTALLSEVSTAEQKASKGWEAHVKS